MNMFSPTSLCGPPLISTAAAAPSNAAFALLPPATRSVLRPMAHCASGSCASSKHPPALSLLAPPRSAASDRFIPYAWKDAPQLPSLAGPFARNEALANAQLLTWNNSALGPESLAVDPAHPAILYAGAAPRSVP